MKQKQTTVLNVHPDSAYGKLNGHRFEIERILTPKKRPEHTYVLLVPAGGVVGNPLVSAVFLAKEVKEIK